MSGAPARRQAVRELIEAGMSEAAACRSVAISRSSYRYVSRRCDETELIEAIKEICTRKRRWGYKRVWARLRREGYAVNRKRIERLWRERGFTQPARRPKKKRRSGETVPLAACHANHVWTLRLHLRRHRRRATPQGAHRALACTRAWRSRSCRDEA